MIPDDIEWLLLLTFPNGGSTAIAKLLLTAPGTIALNPRVEGQWLVPAMSAPGARWDPATRLDYDDIRARWIEAARQAAAAAAPHERPSLVIEKSPPNMCRHQAITAMLGGMKTYVVVLTRDPFATCASWHVRVGVERVARNWGWAGEAPTDEAGYFRALAEIWMRRARYLESALVGAVHWLRYEDFADRPAETLAGLSQKIPRLSAADPGAVVAVKDYKLQPLRNMNREQIAILNQRQTEAISAALAQDPGLIRRFRYDVLPPRVRS
jgi:hypothetical protein